MRPLDFGIRIGLLVAACVANKSGHDTCLLQHQSLSKRATKRLYEEPEPRYSKRAPPNVARQSTTDRKSALIWLGPQPDGKKGPGAGGKTAPAAAGKTPNAGRAPKSGAKTAPVQPGKTPPTTTTTIIESMYGDDETVSKRVEITLNTALKDIDSGPNGPLSKFSSTFQAEIQAAMGLDPERLAILGFRGGYLESKGGATSFTQHGTGNAGEREASNVDFEVLAGKPSAGRSLGRLTTQMADKRSKLMTGTMKGALSGAVLVVSEGSKANDPTNTWREKQTPPTLSPSKTSSGFNTPVTTALVTIVLAMLAVACLYGMRSRLK